MIRKIFNYLFLFFIFSIILFVSSLSTIGIKTDKFNKLISNKIADTKNIDLILQTVNFKLDLSEISLFIETQNPKINYNNQAIPAENIKVYISIFLSRVFPISIKFKKIYLLNFLRLTILFSVLNVFTSYLIYEVSSFELAFNFLSVFKLIVIFLRPLILYFYFKGFAPDIKSKIGTIIIISDFIPSLLLFDSMMLIDLFNYLISLI